MADLDSMPSILARLDAWLRQHRPDYGSQLRPGVPADTWEHPRLKHLPAVPVDLRAFWQWHDGQAEEASAAFQHNRRWLSLDAALEAKALLDDLLADGELQPPNGWHADWLPLLDNGGGDHLCVDLTGVATGRAGQLVSFWHDDPTRTVEHASTHAWLAATVESLEAGEWTHDADPQPIDRAAWLARVSAHSPGLPRRLSVSDAGA